MNDPRDAKKWKSNELMLKQASQFLLEPNRFTLQSQDLKDYENNLRINELISAMNELAEIAHNYGAKSGFWRRLQKAAINMDLQEKVEEYERAFHDALSK